MNKQEFDEIAEELIDSYGDKNYPPKVLGRMWTLFNGLTKNEMQGGIDAALEESPYAPTIAKLRKALKHVLDKNNVNDRQKKMEGLRKENYCQVCGCGGLVNAISAKNALNYSFRCPFCQAASILRLSQKIPLWEPRHRKEYFLCTDNNFQKAKETQERLMFGVARSGGDEFVPQGDLKNVIDDLCGRFSM